MRLQQAPAACQLDGVVLCFRMLHAAGACTCVSVAAASLVLMLHVLRLLSCCVRACRCAGCLTCSWPPTRSCRCMWVQQPCTASASSCWRQRRCRSCTASWSTCVSQRWPQQTSSRSRWGGGGAGVLSVSMCAVSRRQSGIYHFLQGPRGHTQSGFAHQHISAAHDRGLCVVSLTVRVAACACCQAIKLYKRATPESIIASRQLLLQQCITPRVELSAGVWRYPEPQVLGPGLWNQRRFQALMQQLTRLPLPGGWLVVVAHRAGPAQGGCFDGGGTVQRHTLTHLSVCVRRHPRAAQAPGVGLADGRRGQRVRCGAVHTDGQEPGHFALLTAEQALRCFGGRGL